MPGGSEAPVLCLENVTGVGWGNLQFESTLSSTRVGLQRLGLSHSVE